MSPRTRGAMAVLAVVVVGLAALRFAGKSETSVDRRLAVLVRRLEARDSLYRRVICRGISRAIPAASSRFPALFDPNAGPADRRRLEAHEALLALGEAARPALPALARALAHEDPSVRTYTLVVVAHLEPDEAEFMRLVASSGRDVDVATRHLAGVLRDEDERLRDFAWGCLEAAGPAASAARPQVLAIGDDPVADAELRDRAARVLRSLGRPSAEGAGR